MKIKTSFVTNSSSSSYIIIDSNNSCLNLRDSLNNWSKKQIQYSNRYFDIECETFGPAEIEEFKIYNNYDEELDWIQKIVGTEYNRVGSKEAHNIILENLNKGKTIHFLIIDQNVYIDEFINYEDNLEIIYYGGY